MELAATLRSLPRYSALSDSEISAFAEELTVEEHPDGHVFVNEGDGSSDCYIILAGTVAVLRNREPYLDELTRLSPGDTFGLMSLVDGEPAAATCRAMGPVRAAVLEGGALKRLLESHAPLALAVQRLVAEQLARDFRAATAHVHAALEKRARG